MIDICLCEEVFAQLNLKQLCQKIIAEFDFAKIPPDSSSSASALSIH